MKIMPVIASQNSQKAKNNMQFGTRISEKTVTFFEDYYKGKKIPSKLKNLLEKIQTRGDNYILEIVKDEYRSCRHLGGYSTDTNLYFTVLDKDKRFVTNDFVLNNMRRDTNINHNFHEAVEIVGNVVFPKIAETKLFGYLKWVASDAFIPALEKEPRESKVSLIRQEIMNQIKLMGKKIQDSKNEKEEIKYQKRKQDLRKFVQDIRVTEQKTDFINERNERLISSVRRDFEAAGVPNPKGLIVDIINTYEIEDELGLREVARSLNNN